MNKKINFLAIIPFFGSIIIYIWLYIKMTKKKISEKKCNIFFLYCLLVDFLAALVVSPPTVYIVQRFDYYMEFFLPYGLILSLVIIGYIMNLYTFIRLNKKWDDLHTQEPDLNYNKKE